MKAKSLLQMLGKAVHVIVYVVGIFAIFNFAEARWPETSRTFYHGIGIAFLIRQFYLRREKVAGPNDAA